ncbi:hypothetical protein HNQ07_002052 [Deinococcus metalli]|uniref:HEPN AbiU2-like domain-containing protein n=1 Tax=Deinococcus metalli TaxID=1141878 RepID=A0A7W8KF29_9DEIO|nr:hypothetical protein [Deinococcus metalli]MBB5376588.1 hypothetical protein [Deinococcus metalli]GHF42952.1 hypothetical protein GCM10017781_19140 [Deinococcus metalli]
MATDDPVFAFSVEQELDKAGALLARGLAGQRAPHYTDTARFLVMLDLAGGLRQLLQLAAALSTHSEGPPDRTVPLLTLLEAVVRVCPVRLLRTDEGERLHGFLAGDPLLREAVGLLDAFERYRAGDVLVWPGAERRPRAPEFAWRDMEHAVAERLFPDAQERQQRQLSADPAAYQQPVNDEVARVLTTCVDGLYTLLSVTSNVKAVRTGPARWRQQLEHGRRERAGPGRG